MAGFCRSIIEVMDQMLDSIMIKNRPILENSQNLSLIATIVLFAFAYGVFVGYSGKMLYLDSKNITTKDTVNGRFGQIVKSL